MRVWLRKPELERTVGGRSLMLHPEGASLQVVAKGTIKRFKPSNLAFAVDGKMNLDRIGV